jgi:hypothetical protein
MKFWFVFPLTMLMLSPLWLDRLGIPTAEGGAGLPPNYAEGGAGLPPNYAEGGAGLPPSYAEGGAGLPPR